MGKWKKTIVLTFLWILALAFPVYISWAATTVVQNSYLPIINNAKLPTATNTLPPPTPTNTQSPPTPTYTPSPTPTQGPPPPTGNVVITTIFYHGIKPQQPDEYVEIRNDAVYAIQLANWTLRDQGYHIYTFPSFVIQPGQVCRIYTNENHPEWCGFNYGSGSPIWNDTGDCGYLRDSANTPINQFCY